MKKRQLLAGLLALIMALALLPATALADEDLPLCDVYQGDGFYITVKPFAVKSTKYTLCKVNQNFYDGYVFVETADIDENYVNRRFVRELNLADKDGNIVLPEGRMHYSSAITTYLTSGHYAPSEGLVAFWDGESKNPGSSETLMGFMDYQGNVVIPCQFDNNYIQPFHDGLAVVGNRIVIDKTGREAFSYREKGISSLMADHYDQGLIPATKFNPTSQTYGYIDGQGNMVLPLVTVPDGTQDRWQGYADGTVEGYLMPYYGSRFSDDGYAVVQDLRSGDKLAYAYAIIDTSGNVVGTFRDMEPQDSWASGGFHDGLLRVAFIDNRGQTDGYGYIDTSGNVVLREGEYLSGGLYAGGDYHCGVTVAQGGAVIDKKGNVVIPAWTFESELHIGVHHFSDNLAMAYSGNQPYVLEKHEGVYTGPGKVYNHARGGVQTSTPAQPETPAQPAAPTVGSFTDVAANSPFKDAILWAVEQNITSGTSATTFSPSDTCTVRQILTFLWRSAGKPGGAAEGQSELDAAVAWAIAQGILPAGADAGAPCTRASAVTYMWKAAGSPAPARAAAFDDVPAGAAYAQAVSWAVERGVTRGTSDTAFSPNDTCTRGQIVTFLHRGQA